MGPQTQYGHFAEDCNILALQKIKPQLLACLTSSQFTLSNTLSCVLCKYKSFEKLKQHSPYKDYGTGWKVWDSNPGRGRKFPLLQNTQTSCGVHPVSYSMIIEFFSRIKATGA